MIKLEHIFKTYGNKYIEIQALKNINLEVSKGELLAITGTSGSGKTTLLNILGAMDTFTSGTYYFKGKNISNYTIKQLNKFRKDNVSFVFQNFELMKKYTVYENVEMPLLARNIKNRKLLIEKTLDILHILDLKDKYPSTLSGGEQQRCAIARALVCDTDLILADEPTGALDKNTSNEILSILKDINKLGKTIIIITHDMDIANQCNKIIKIEDGMIIT